MVDPLTVLLMVAPEEQRQCYLENATKGHAIAAWDTLLGQTFSGGDRFQRAQEYLDTWQKRVSFCSESPEGPYFFCSFSFFDTWQDQVPGFAPATIVLPRWQVVRHRQRCTLIANVLIRPHTALAPLATAIAAQLQHLKSASLTAAPSPEGLALAEEARSPGKLSPQAAADFQQQVHRTLTRIRTSNLQKQVVAYTLDIQRSHSFQPAMTLIKLRSRHPDCYIFSLSGGPHTHFIGASPERLLSIRQRRLVTDALAGSAPRGQTPAADHELGQRLLNTPKEQREHQLVLEFIVHQLRAQGLAPRYSTPPSLLRLPHIQHLHTPICADLPDQVSPLHIVAALHPTPAVAGVPTHLACEQIQQGERCDRGLYAAPFGWVDAQGNSEFIVGIRSALIQGNHARLYAGAGIVAGSDPQQELAEIQLKLQALAEALE